MRVPWATALAVLVALLVPGVIIVSGIRLLAHPTFVHAEYRRSGFPADGYGFTTAQRTALGLTGLHSVLPGGEGIALLRAARLPDGKPAFGAREIRHMSDVRTWIGRFWWFQLGGLVLIGIAGVLLLPRARTRALFPRGLRWGAVLTLAVAAAIGVVMAVSWNTFFVDFHRLFFAGRHLAVRRRHHAAAPLSRPALGRRGDRGRHVHRRHRPGADRRDDPLAARSAIAEQKARVAAQEAHRPEAGAAREEAVARRGDDR